MTSLWLAARVMVDRYFSKHRFSKSPRKLADFQTKDGLRHYARIGESRSGISQACFLRYETASISNRCNYVC